MYGTRMQIQISEYDFVCRFHPHSRLQIQILDCGFRSRIRTFLWISLIFRSILISRPFTYHAILDHTTEKSTALQWKQSCCFVFMKFRCKFYCNGQTGIEKVNRQSYHWTGSHFSSGILVLFPITGLESWWNILNRALLVSKFGFTTLENLSQDANRISSKK